MEHESLYDFEEEIENLLDEASEALTHRDYGMLLESMRNMLDERDYEVEYD